MQKLSSSLLGFICFGFALFGHSINSLAQEQPKILFTRDVAPLLLKHCVACHGAKNPRGEYQLHTWERLKTPGAGAAAPLVAGKPGESEWLRLITNRDAAERMPLDRPALSAAEIALVTRWIEQGAEYDAPDPAAPLWTIAVRPPEPGAPRVYPRALPIRALAAVDEGRAVLVGGYHELTEWNLADGKLRRRIGNVPQRVTALAVSPDQQWIALAGGTPGISGTVRVYARESGELKRELAFGSDVFNDVAWSLSGTELAAAGADRTLRVWSWPEGRETLNIEAHADWVQSAAWSGDGKHLLTASRDKTARLFDTSGKLVGGYTEHDKPLLAAVFAPDPKYALDAGLEGNVLEWELATGERFKPKEDKPKKDEKKEKKVDQPDKKDDAKADPPTAEEALAARRDRRGNPFGGGEYEIARLAVWDQDVLAAAGSRLRRFAWATRQERAEYRGAEGAILAVAVDAPRDRILAGDSAGNVLIWQGLNPEPAGKFLVRPGE